MPSIIPHHVELVVEDERSYLEYKGRKLKIEVGELGEGSFGEVLKGTSCYTGQKVAIKIERQDVARPSLPLEFAFYKRICDTAGFPMPWLWIALVRTLRPSLKIWIIIFP